MPKSHHTKDIWGYHELTDKKGGLAKALLAEFLGNFLLNFFGCASCVNVTDPKAPADYVRISLAFGLVIFTLVQAFSHVSGAHLNPAVTAALLVTNKVPIIRGFLYIILQCLGSIVGSAILKALTPNDPLIQGTLGLTKVNPKLSSAQGFGIEYILGLILIMVVFGFTDPNRDLYPCIAPFAIGLTVAMGHLATVDLTGSSMNPARSLGSAVVANVWSDHWVYWLGPLGGGLTAALMYHFIFKAPEREEHSPDYASVRVDEKELS